MGRERIGNSDEEQTTSSRQKIGRRVVEKVRESVGDDDTERGSGSQSFLGGVLGAVMDIVDDAAKKDSSSNEGNRKGSGRKPVARNEGRVSSVAGSVAEQLRRKN